MKTLFKIIAGIVALVVVLVVAAAVLIPMFFDPNDFKDEAAALVKKHTGRDLRVEGDIGLTVFPWLGMDLGVVELGNAPGFKAPHFARSERINIRLKLMPLLRKEIEMDTITVHGLALNVERKADGTSNIPAVASEDGQPSGESKTPGAGELGLASIAIGGVDVREGQLSWSDEGAGTAYRLSNLTVQTGSLALGKPVQLDVSFDVAGGKPAIDGRVSLNAEVDSDLDAQVHHLRGVKLGVGAKGEGLPNGALNLDATTDAVVDLAQGTAKLTGLNVNTGELALSGGLDVESLTGDPTYRGTFNLAQVDLKALLVSLGAAPIETADDKALRSMSSTFSVSGNTRQVSLDPLEVRLDRSTLKGRLSVADFASSALRFDLSLDQIDADRYLPPASQGGGAGTPGAAAGASSDIPTDTLRGINAAGKLRIGKLKIAKLDLSQIGATLDAKNGLIRLNPVSAKLYGGSYAGNIRLDASGKTPSLSVNETLSGVQAGDLLTALQGEDRLSGTTDLKAALTARGAGPQAMKRSLSGKVRFDFRNGAIKGFNLNQMLRDAKAKLTGGSAGGASGPNQTDFSELGGTININNGLARNTDLAAKAPFLRIGGKGQAHLAEETIDYRLTTTVVATGRGQGGDELKDLAGIAIPVKIGGTFAQPSYGLDFEALAGAFARSKASAIVEKQKEAITAKAKEAIGDKLGDKLGGKLGGVLGGSAKSSGDTEGGSNPADKIGGALKGLFKN